MLIRDERNNDHGAIRELVAAAFRDKSFSHQTEHFIVDALRSHGVLTLSLVAEDEGIIVGHAAFSPVTIDGELSGWHALGPLAVIPDRQGRGVGQSLVTAGIERLRSIGSNGCVVLGNPAYYGRFHFRNDPRVTLMGFPPEHFMIRPFAPLVPQGEVAFHPAFDVTV